MYFCWIFEVGESRCCDILLNTKTLFTPAFNICVRLAETDSSLHLALTCVSNSSPVITFDQISQEGSYLLTTSVLI